MTEKKKKTLEELEKEVADSQLGLISDEDLRALFEDEKQTVETPNAQTPVDANAPTQQAPATVTAEPSAPQPNEGEPNFLELVPEKFRDKDLKASIAKMAKSYSDIEAVLQKQAEELTKNREFVENLTTLRPTAPSVQEPHKDIEEKEEEFDDVACLERPKEAMTKISRKEAKQIAKEAIKQYHETLVQATTRAKVVDEFRKANPDFDNYRNEMLEVLRQRPDLEHDPRALPVIYDWAKKLAAQRVESLKTQLGIAPQQQQQQPPIDVEQLKTSIRAEAVEQAKREILEDIRKRKAAAGTLPGSPPTTVEQRIENTQKQKQLTPEDKIFEEMISSGPRTLELG